MSTKKPVEDKLTFAAWRDQQFGARSISPNVSDEELQKFVEKGRSAQEELNRRQVWDSRVHAALLAWAVRGKDKVVS